MNCLCSQARSYLQANERNETEITNFLDKYINELNSYTNNGLSSYMLECVEVAIKLSKSISYREGEGASRIIKGNFLSNGGQYKLAIRSFKLGIQQVDRSSKYYPDAVVKVVFSLVITGNESMINDYLTMLEDHYPNEYNKCLSFINLYNHEVENSRSSYIPAEVKSLEDYLLLSENYKNQIADVIRSESLLGALDNSKDIHNCTVLAHLESLKCLSLRMDNIADKINEIFSSFNSKDFFILYIDGLLNIVETFIKFNLPDNAFKLLGIVLEEKREITLFDSRINELKIRCQAVLTI